MQYFEIISTSLITVASIIFVYIAGKYDMLKLIGLMLKEKVKEYDKCIEIAKQGPLTNADRIRKMSDEELAEWILNLCQFEDRDEEPMISIYNLDTKNTEEIYDSYGALLEWLQRS